MRLSVVILPIYHWSEARPVWREAEELGFHAAYTYDHLSWRSFQDRPWFGSVPTLTAAATATEVIRLGTMVSSPNFRHPVTYAKDLMTIDDVSGGRLTVGIGAGGLGFDATVLGQEALPLKGRADRFAEFVALADRLLTHENTTVRGEYYSAVEARMIPGCVQRPRVPFTIAAAGPRGMRLAAEYGQGWVTFGDAGEPDDPTVEHSRTVIARQVEMLAEACEERGRDTADIDRVLLWSASGPERPMDSVDAFVEYAGAHAAMGFDELILHWPVPDSVFDFDEKLFRRIVTDGLAQLG